MGPAALREQLRQRDEQLLGMLQQAGASIPPLRRAALCRLDSVQHLPPRGRSAVLR